MFVNWLPLELAWDRSPFACCQGSLHRSSTAAVTQGLVRCGDKCALTGFVGWHHDRLLAVEEDPEAIVELMELAVTWSELDYSTVPIISPEHWMSFFASHRWTEPERAERIFSVARDIATAAARTNVHCLP